MFISKMVFLPLTDPLRLRHLIRRLMGLELCGRVMHSHRERIIAQREARKSLQVREILILVIFLVDAFNGRDVLG